MQLKLKIINNEIRLFPLSREDIEENLIIEDTDWNFLNHNKNEFQEIELINNELKLIFKTDKFDEYKQYLLKQAKTNIENTIYLQYPIYKQNNIAIFGTDEEKQTFKEFHNTKVAEYDQLVKKINNANSFEELENL